MASPPSSPASITAAGNGTGEILAALLRPGNAGANSAEDHIRVFTRRHRTTARRLLRRTGDAHRGEGAGAHRQRRGLPEIPPPPRITGRAVQCLLPGPGAARPTWSVGSTTKSTGSRPWTRTASERADAWVINATDDPRAHRLPGGDEPVPARRTAAPRGAADLARYRRAPDHRVPDELTALARTRPWMPGTGPGAGARTGSRP